MARTPMHTGVDGEIKYLEHRDVYVGFLNGRVCITKKTAEAVQSFFEENGITPGWTKAVPKSEFTVDERFHFIETFVSMIARKQMNSMVITGDGGLGKSHTVVETLKKLGKKEMGYGVDDYVEHYDFVVIKGFSTAKALYRTLFEQNGKIIIFDDADSVHKDQIAANILKGALDSNDKRVISWGSESDDGLPSRFEFTGRCVFISNLSLARFPQALISRSVKVDLTLNTEEKLDRIEYVMKSVKCDAATKNEVMMFLRKHANAITDLNVRSGLSVLKIAQTLGENWQRIALYTVSA